MAQKMLKVCRCRQCKKARRKGLVLGTRTLVRGWWRGEKIVGGFVRVSDYVLFPRFSKGRSAKTRSKMAPKVEI